MRPSVKPLAAAACALLSVAAAAAPSQAQGYYDMPDTAGWLSSSIQQEFAFSAAMAAHNQQFFSDFMAMCDAHIRATNTPCLSPGYDPTALSYEAMGYGDLHRAWDANQDAALNAADSWSYVFRGSAPYTTPSGAVVWANPSMGTPHLGADGQVGYGPAAPGAVPLTPNF